MHVQLNTNRSPLGECPAYIDKHLQVTHWECDTIIGAKHKQDNVAVIHSKSTYAVMAKVSNQLLDLAGRAIRGLINLLGNRL